MTKTEVNRLTIRPPVSVTAFRDHGLIAAAASDNVVRLLPPLIVTNAEIDEAVARLDAALTTIEQAAPVAKAG